MQQSCSCQPNERKKGLTLFYNLLHLQGRPLVDKKVTLLDFYSPIHFFKLYLIKHIQIKGLKPKDHLEIDDIDDVIYDLAAKCCAGLRNSQILSKNAENAWVNL